MVSGLSSHPLGQVNIRTPRPTLNTLQERHLKSKSGVKVLDLWLDALLESRRDCFFGIRISMQKYCHEWEEER